MKKQLFFLTFFFVAFFAQGQSFRNYIPLKERGGSIQQQRERSTINPTDIAWWVGSGDQSAILIVNWCDPEMALAWGFRWDGDLTVENMMDSITAADYRFSYDASNGFLNDIIYADSLYNLSIFGSYFMYNINGSLAGQGFATQELQDGDLVEWGDAICADVDGYSYSWNNIPIAVTNPNDEDGTDSIPNDVTIAPENIIYWIGEGSNEMIFIVNWCDPEIALAWGYRFDEESIALSDIMDDIAENDYRFSYVLGDLGVGDIRYQDSTLNLSSDGSYFMFLINGGLGQVGYREQLVYHGDYIKWGEYSCAHTDVDYNMSWTTEITPVTIPSGTAINTFDNVSLTLRPNPATDYVRIDYSGNMINNTVSVSDINGRLIYQEVLDKNSMIISTSGLKNGVYFVRITNDRFSKVEKLIITK